MLCRAAHACASNPASSTHALCQCPAVHDTQGEVERHIFTSSARRCSARMRQSRLCSARDHVLGEQRARHECVRSARKRVPQSPSARLGRARGNTSAAVRATRMDQVARASLPTSVLASSAMSAGVWVSRAVDHLRRDQHLLPQRRQPKRTKTKERDRSATRLSSPEAASGTRRSGGGQSCAMQPRTQRRGVRQIRGRRNAASTQDWSVVPAAGQVAATRVATWTASQPHRP